MSKSPRAEMPKFPKTTLTDEEIIERCHNSVFRMGHKHPHFLIVHARVRNLYRVHRGSSDVKTMGITSRGHIHVDADLVAGLDIDQLGGCICHELLHLVLMHHTRNIHRHPKLFNIANDMVINEALKESGISLPEWVVFKDPEYDGEMLSEAVYDWLLNNQKYEDKKSGSSTDSQAAVGNGCGVDDSLDEGGDDQGPGAVDAAGNPIDWRVVAAEMAAIAEQVVSANAGSGSMAIHRLLDPKPAKVHWRSVLRRGMSGAASRYGRDFQTMAHRNRRSPPTGPQLPGWTGRSSTVCVIADVSGSMGEEFVNRLLAEARGMLKQFENLRMFFITHTSQVEWAGWISSNTVHKLAEAVQYTGGTDPEPAYQLAKDTVKRFDSIVHFTDAEFVQSTWPSHNGAQLIVGIYGSGGSCPPPPGAVVVECFIDT